MSPLSCLCWRFTRILGTLSQHIPCCGICQSRSCTGSSLGKTLFPPMIFNNLEKALICSNACRNFKILTTETSKHLLGVITNTGANRHFMVTHLCNKKLKVTKTSSLHQQLWDYNLQILPKDSPVHCFLSMKFHLCSATRIILVTYLITFFYNLPK